MKRIVIALPLFLLTVAVSATECDCSSYPFKPNPPCYGICISNLSSSKNINLTNVKNIDPGVAVGIKVISESKYRETTNFMGIKEKADLEREALRLINFKTPEH